MFDRFLLEWNQLAGTVVVALINVLPASVVLTAAVWVVLLLRRSWTAATRYWVWSIVLALVLIMPLADPFVSHYSKSVRAENARHEMSKYVPASGVKLLEVAAQIPVATAPDPQPVSIFTISGLLLLVWVSAGLVQFARLALAFRNTARLRRSAILPAVALEEQWLKVLQACGVTRPVTLRLASAIGTPAVTGYFHPVVLLPAAVSDRLSGNELDQILLHELAHVRRYDDWAIGLQRLVEAVFVLDPLVHFLGKKLELEREIACDDWVLSGQPPRAYASCLAKLAEFCIAARPPSLTSAALEHKSQLRRRIEMLLDGTRSIATRASLRSIGSAAAAMFLLVCMSFELPRVMAYPVPQTPVPPVAPAPPQAPAAPQSPAAPIAPRAPQASNDTDSIAVYSKDGQSYAYQYSGSESIFVHPDSSKAGTIRFRRNGKSYVIRDAATVRSAEEILRPQEELGRRQAELGEQQGKLGEQQAMLGAEQAKAFDKQLNPRELENLKRELKRLQTEMNKINLEESMRTASEAQVQIAKLQAELGEAQSELGREQSHTAVDQSQFGEQQSKLGEQQSRLGELQSNLGEEQSRAAKKAGQKLRELINRALANGLAQPIQ